MRSPRSMWLKVCLPWVMVSASANAEEAQNRKLPPGLDIFFNPPDPECEKIKACIVARLPSELNAEYDFDCKDGAIQYYGSFEFEVYGFRYRSGDQGISRLYSIDAIPQQYRQLEALEYQRQALRKTVEIVLESISRCRGETALTELPPDALQIRITMRQIGGFSDKMDVKPATDSWADLPGLDRTQKLQNLRTQVLLSVKDFHEELGLLRGFALEDWVRPRLEQEFESLLGEHIIPQWETLKPEERYAKNAQDRSDPDHTKRRAELTLDLDISVPIPSTPDSGEGESESEAESEGEGEAEAESEGEGEGEGEGGGDDETPPGLKSPPGDEEENDCSGCCEIENRSPIWFCFCGLASAEPGGLTHGLSALALSTPQPFTILQTYEAEWPLELCILFLRLRFGIVGMAGFNLAPIPAWGAGVGLRSRFWFKVGTRNLGVGAEARVMPIWYQLPILETRDGKIKGTSGGKFLGATVALERLFNLSGKPLNMDWSFGWFGDDSQGGLYSGLTFYRGSRKPPCEEAECSSKGESR